MKEMDGTKAVVRPPYEIGEVQLLNNSWGVGATGGGNVVEILAHGAGRETQLPCADSFTLAIGSNFRMLNGLSAGKDFYVLLENGNYVPVPDPNPPAGITEYVPPGTSEPVPIAQAGIDCLKANGAWVE